MRLLSRGWIIGILAAGAAASCAGGFDDTRQERPYKQNATLGQEVYGVLCDRLGAGALAEDLSGRSYHGICHPDEQGHYEDHVNTALLPPVSGASAIARNLAVAKLERFAQRRAETVKALDVIVPDIEIKDPYPPESDPGRKIRLHEAVADFLTRLNPLYDSNPLEVEGGDPVPLLPAATQALARLFKQIEANPASRAALARIGGRKGYHPANIGLGALAPIVRYPHLRTFSQQAVHILSPGGAARTEFVQLLKVLHQETRTSKTSQPLGPYVIKDASIVQPNRPMDTWEMAGSILLSTDPSFAPPELKPGWIARRDYRGFALAVGSSFGVKNSVPAPFADENGDGLADVDAFGRFVGKQGAPISVDFPFVVPGEPRVRPADSFGRALLPDNKTLAYQYINTSQTLAAASLQDVGSLLDPDPSNERETLMYAMAGLNVLLGARKDMTYAYGEGKDQQTISYKGFDPDTSPLVDLVYALGPILADPQSDDYLQQMIDLFQNHEQEVARVVGAMLKIKEIADKHPEAGLPADSVFWDQMADVLGRVSQVGPSNGDPDGKSLMENVLLAFTDPRAAGIGGTYSKFMTYRDVLNYNPDDVNGPAKNYSGPSGVPGALVDRSKPAVGANRSMFQRTIQMIYDSTKVTACSKKEARVQLKAGLLGLSVDATYPVSKGIVQWGILCPGKVNKHPDWCDIFEIPDLTSFYIQSIIEDDPNLPKSLNQGKAELKIKDACLTSLGGFTDMDKTLTASSGLTGLTTHPTHLSLHRLVFFGADAANLSMPDLDPYRDGKNQQMNAFISGLQEPMGSPLCPKNARGVNVCTKPEETLRGRDKGTLFLWEHFGFADSNRPVLYPFYERGREDLFEDMIDVVHFHMDVAKDVQKCDSSGGWRRSDPKFNPRLCYGDGIVRYEPIMAEALKTDLIPALMALTKAVAAEKVPSVRYRKNAGFSKIDRRGTEVLASLVRLLFDPVYSAKIGLTDRKGSKSVLWSDGKTVKPQVTPFDLAANALHGIDQRFASAKDFSAEERASRHKQWLKARSQLVDKFLAVDGTGASAHFRNKYMAHAMVNILRVLRQQLNAHCPDREKGKACDWARRDLSQKTADLVSDPLFASVVDLMDAINKEPSRAELERLLQYLLKIVNNDDASVRQTLATVSDAVMLLRDGQTTPPLLNVVAPLLIPDDSGADTAKAGPGAADITLQVLNVLSRDVDDKHGPDDPLVFDRYHVLEHILPNLVKPVDSSANSKTAIEVLVDVALDIERYDSGSSEPLSADDYTVIAKSLEDLLLSKTRGMEQLYTVVRGGDGN